MRSLIVFGTDGAPPGPELVALRDVSIDGVSTRSAVIETSDDTFDMSLPSNAGHAVVRVRAFSCNYRDRGVFPRLRSIPSHIAIALGSDFVGEVVALAPDVATLRCGDRVIPDHSYCGCGRLPSGARDGFPTDAASTEILLLDARKLMVIPLEMPDVEAAAFSVGAQTAYSMIRRLQIQPGANVLVMAGSSNTSLFVLSALRDHSVTCVATSTSDEKAERLRAVAGVEVAVLGSPDSIDRLSTLQSIAARIGNFDHVIDPYFDMYAHAAVSVMRASGSYITCGFAGQSSFLGRAAHTPKTDLASLFQCAVIKNLTLHGNCLGESEDLAQAISDFRTQRLTVVIDSVYRDEQAVEFLVRSFNDSGRFGKVVFSYAP
jgi:NADPH:quinone reductase-like Zn-dependent oxidoreductase